MTRRSVQATIDDVARRADVSISTVSRVVNRTIPVSDAVAARVEAAMHELNYVPRTAARNLAARSTHTMGLLLTDLLGDFFAPLLYGIESGANAHGYDLLISTAGRRGPHNVLPRSLGAHNTDGLLVFAGSLTADGIRHAYSTGLPVVLIHQTPPADVPLPCVTIENKAASRAIVEHLILVHKRRRIVLLRGLENNEDAFWREAGYREALAAHQIEQDPRLCVPGDFERSVALVSVTRLLDERIEFDAIFAGDDEAAVGAYSALQRAGKRIPEDVSIVGFDDQRLASVLRPPLTTVRAPTEQVGRVAVEQLVALIRTGQAEPLTLLHGELVIRQSCGCSVSTP